MDRIETIGVIVAALAVCGAAAVPALAEGRAVAAALAALAHRQDSAAQGEEMRRTLYVGLAMIETLAIAALVVALLVFAGSL